MTVSDHLQNSQQWSSKLIQGSKSSEPATGSWAAKGQRCMWGAKAYLCVQSNRRSTVGQIVEEVDAGSHRSVSEHTEHTQWSTCLDGPKGDLHYDQQAVIMLWLISV